LRKKRGDIIYVFDGKGGEFRARIERIRTNIIELSILGTERSAEQSVPRVSLAFSLLKSDKVDFVLQKSTELGVDEFFPFISRNTIAKSPGISKINHWKKIILESSAQSKRLFVPKLNDVLTVECLTEKISHFDLILVAQPSSLPVSVVLGRVDKEAIDSILLVVGPEGGFVPSEIEKFKVGKKLHLVKISNFILRAETACMILSGLTANIFNKDEV